MTRPGPAGFTVIACVSARRLDDRVVIDVREGDDAQHMILTQRALTLMLKTLRAWELPASHQGKKPPVTEAGSNMKIRKVIGTLLTVSALGVLGFTAGPASAAPAVTANGPDGADQLVNSQANGGAAYIVLLDDSHSNTALFGTTILSDSPKFFSTAEAGGWFEWKVVGYPGKCVYWDATAGDYNLKTCDNTKASDLWKSSSPNFYSQLYNEYQTVSDTLYWTGFSAPLGYSNACGTCAPQHWHWADVV